MSDSPVRVDLQIAAEGELPEGVDLNHWVAATCESVVFERPPVGAITVRLVETKESQALNSTYRQKDSPTNVLAFPGPEAADLLSDDERELGDLVICLPVVFGEAEQQGKAPLAHLAHLVVHGTLHLFGYDHDTDHSAEQMEGLEAKIMERLGFPNPYKVA